MTNETKATNRGRLEVLTIRQIGSGDFEDLAQLFEENNQREITRQFHPFPLNKASAYAIATSPGRELYYVGVAESRLIAFAMLRGWDEGYAAPSIGAFVDKKHQGLGYGREMLKVALCEARKRGCSRVRLSVYESNRRALHLYQSLGFVETGRATVKVEGEEDVKIAMETEV